LKMKTRKSKRVLIKSNWFEKFTNKNNFTAQLTDPFFKTAGRHIKMVLICSLNLFQKYYI